MACVIVAIVPYGLLVSETGINVTWATVAVPVIGTPFLWSLFLTITWSKATSKGVLSGTKSDDILLNSKLIHVIDLLKAANTLGK